MAEVRMEWRRGLLNDIANSNEVADELRAVGERVLSTARSIAPVKSGDYLRGLHGTTDTHRRRVVVHVGAGADVAAGMVERKHHVLANALGAARG